MNERPLVSVIVAARNAQRSVERLLASLDAQTVGRERVEVVVVDDASTDGTAAAARAAGADVVVELGTRGGSYAARNAGLERASGRIVATTDSDCRPSPGWLEAGVEALERTGADLVGGAIEVAPGPSPSLAELVDVARGIDQRRCVEEWGFAATANLLARREVFESVGVFNGSLVSGGDNEFCRRATAAGKRLVYAPEAAVSHAPRRRIREIAKKGYRVGFGSGQMPFVAEGPARDWPRLWATPRAWVPRRGLLGVERLREAGAEPSRARLALLDLVQHAFVQVPMLAGSLSASLRKGKGF